MEGKHSCAPQMATATSHSISPAVSIQLLKENGVFHKMPRVSQSNNNPLPETSLKLFYSSWRGHLLPTKVTEGDFPYWCNKCEECGSCNWGLAGPQNLSVKGFPNSEPSMPTQPISCPCPLSFWTFSTEGIEELSTAEAGGAARLTLLASNILCADRSAKSRRANNKINGMISCPPEKWDVHLVIVPAQSTGITSGRAEGGFSWDKPNLLS